MKSFAAALVMLLCCGLAFADPPSLIGPPSEDTANNVIRAKVGDPPLVSIKVKDAGKDDVETWNGPIGDGQIAAYARDGGIVVSTAIPGSFAFRCILQTPTAGLDAIRVLDATLIVDGLVPPGPGPTPPGPTPPGPTPPTPPVPSLADQVAAAVAAKPDAALTGTADMYETIAKQAESGAITVADILSADKLATVLSPSWAEIRAAVVTPYLKKLTLAKPADYAPVWHQIVAGIRAGLGPQPPPNPPGPTPDPPAPMPVQELRVLILYDETANLTVAQDSLINSAPLRTWLNEQGAKWHIWPTTVDASMQDKSWQTGIANRSGPGPVWLQVSNGKDGYNAALPATLDEVKAIVTKYKN